MNGGAQVCEKMRERRGEMLRGTKGHEKRMKRVTCATYEIIHVRAM
jgi:hypothetical protein